MFYSIGLSGIVLSCLLFIFGLIKNHTKNSIVSSLGILIVIGVVIYIAIISKTSETSFETYSRLILLQMSLFLCPLFNSKKNLLILIILYISSTLMICSYILN